MRKRGEMPWHWLADNTRWMRKPTTHDNLAAMMERSQELYRRALWNDQDAYVEVWLEKDALAGVLYDVTETWDVPLMVTRGYSINNVATKAIQVSGGPDDQGIDYWTNDTEGMRIHGSYVPVTEIGSGALIMEPPMVVANSVMNSGETVNSSGKAIFTFDKYGTFILNYDSTFTVAGIETVTVPAGTYETVMSSGSYRIYGSILGQPFDETTTTTRWLAKYIGVVKDTYTDSDGSETHILINTNVKPPVRFLPLLPLLLD